MIVWLIMLEGETKAKIKEVILQLSIAHFKNLVKDKMTENYIFWQANWNIFKIDKWKFFYLNVL